MNKERIEGLSINYLKNILLKTGYITPYVSENDKTPSWDGCVILRSKKDSASKENLRRVFVQVKGKEVAPPYQSQISFPIDVKDLNNYLNDCGVIYFVVYLDGISQYKIYYVTLTRLILRRALKNKNNNKTISFILNQLPDDLDEISDIFFNFSLEMQRRLPEKDLTLENILVAGEKISGFTMLNMRYCGVKYRDDPLGYFFTHPTTLSIHNPILGISIPIGTVMIQQIFTSREGVIAIGDKVYYNHYNIERIGEKHAKIKFGQNFILELKCTDTEFIVKFDYGIKGFLDDRIYDTRFLLDLFSKRELSIDKQLMKFPESETSRKELDIEYFNHNLRLLELTKQLLETLNVKTPLNYDIVTEEDKENLIKLINIFLFGRTFVPDNKREIIFRPTIGNIQILLIVQEINKNQYTLVDFFSDKNKIDFMCQFDNVEFRIPKSFVFKRNDFVLIDNINFDLLFDDIVASQNNHDLRKYTYYFMEQMISGFHKRTKEKTEFAKIIEKCLEYLKNNVPDYDYNSLEQSFISSE